MRTRTWISAALTALSLIVAVPSWADPPAPDGPAQDIDVTKIEKERDAAKADAAQCHADVQAIANALAALAGQVAGVAQKK